MLNQEDVDEMLEIDDIIEEMKEPIARVSIPPQNVEIVRDRFELNSTQINKLKNIFTKLTPTKIVFEPDNKITIEMTL
jgi:hypothetical protein